MNFESLHRRRSNSEIQESKKQAMHFEKAWSQPKHIEIGNENFDLYDVSPESPKTNIPVAIMPGWSHTPEVWKENARVLVENGRRVVSLDAPHGSDQLRAAEAEDIPEAELRRVSAFLAGLDATGLQKVDAMGHSEGAIDILLAAKLEPDRFRTVILINPGGLIGSDVFTSLVGRFAVEKTLAAVRGIREGTLSKSKTSFVEGIKSVMRQPVRAFKEVQAIANANLVHLLRDIKEKEVNIVIIHSAEDPVFPFLRMNKSIQKEKRVEDRLGETEPELGGEILKLLDGVYSVKGGHEEFIYKAEDYTRLAEAAFTAMEGREKSQA